MAGIIDSLVFSGLEIFKKFVKISFEKIVNKTEKDFSHVTKPIDIASKTKFLNELKKTDKVGDNNLIDLLRYYQLINEIQIANGI